MRPLSWGSAGPDVVDRQLRASDLPRPTSHAAAYRAVQQREAARQLALLRMSGFRGFAEGEGAVSADVAAGGGASAGTELALGAGVGRSVMVGVGVMVGATIALRLIDGLWRKR